MKFSGSQHPCLGTKHSHDSEEYFLENCHCYILLDCETALLLPAFWQNVICAVSELDQHAADFRGGGFPLSIVSSYHSYSKKKGESGAWRKVSTSPRKKSGRFSPPAWNKPGLSEEGEGGAGARVVWLPIANVLLSFSMQISIERTGSSRYISKTIWEKYSFGFFVASTTKYM